MTSAELQTKTALFASAGLLAAIGANENGTAKLFPDEIPDDTELPAGQYARGDSQPEYTLDSTLAASRVVMSVVIWAKTRAQADAIALQVTDAMTTAGHAQTSSTNTYEAELDEYAALRVFDVWEI